MEIKEQDLNWDLLTEDARKYFVRLYHDYVWAGKEDYVNRPFWIQRSRELEKVFGEKNLEEERTPQKMLSVPLEKLQGLLPGVCNKEDEKVKSLLFDLYGKKECQTLIMNSITGLDNDLPEKTLLEKYWRDGNIFVFNTNEKRMVWRDSVINGEGCLGKSSFTDDLIVKSRPGLFVIKIYSPAEHVAYFSGLLDITPENVLWRRSEYIYTKSEVKEKLGIPRDKDFIILDESSES